MKTAKLLVLITLLSLLLAGCGGSAGTSAPECDGEDRPQLPETQADKEENPQAPVYDDSLLEEIVVEEDVRNGDETISLSYHMPQLISDAPGALALNQEIQALGDFEETFYSSITWEHHWNGSLLSLVLECGMPYSEWVENHIYNYDLTRDCLLTGQEVLDRAGVAPEIFETALRRCAAQEFDRENTFLATMTPAFPRFLSAELTELRAQTLSQQNLSTDAASVYLDSEGRPSAEVWISTPAGAGLYPRLLTPSLTWDGVEKTVECDFISATLQNNAVTVTFHDRGMAGLFLPKRTLEMGKAYPVEGLYGTYTDIALGFVGNGGDACLLLLDENGCISLCNLMRGLDSGPRFIAAGPLASPCEVASLYFVKDPAGSSAIAVGQDGTETDLYEAIPEAAATVPFLLDDSSWTTGDSSCVLTFGKDSTGLTLDWEGPDGQTAQGRTWYMGVTEEGMVYGFGLLSDTSPSYGTLVLTCENIRFLPAGEADLTLHQQDGEAVPGLEEGAEIHMIRTWG